MHNANTRKGVSPLIAAVLLIAFTMAVAAILTAWVTQFTNERTGEVSNRSQQLVECSYAGVNVYDANYNSGTLDVTVANTGTVDLANVSIFAFTDASVSGQTFMTDLEAGSLQTASISGLSSQPDRIRTSSRQCPSSTDEETQISNN